MQIERLEIFLRERKLVDIAFEIKHSLALVGQSGSGKSLTLKALMGMLPKQMDAKLKLHSDFELQAGQTLAYVPQNPFTALSPLTKIKKQFFHPVEEIEKTLELVGLDPLLLERFSPELSGGQLQRIVLAMALITKPKLLMLDEPTTALDPQTRLVIIDLLKRLQEKLQFKMLFVTHDMHSAQLLCEEICVIKEGKVIESGKMKSVCERPKEAYTQTLLDANFANRDFRV